MNLWEKILHTLQPKVNRQSFNTWLKPTQQLSLADDVLQIEVPSLQFVEWISRNYLPLIQESARELECGDLRVRFTSRQGVGTGGVLGSRPSTGLLATTVPLAPKSPTNVRAGGAPHFSDGEPSMARPLPAGPLQAPGISSALNSRYTFDTFVVSRSNELAHAASVRVADHPSGAYNPLFIYGGVGLGKTHLMHAIGHQIARSLPGLRHLYISSETFMNELINSIRFEKTLDFKERYRKVDLLLIDDIQFLAGKERTQEEFFHTFNALYESQKQIVITSDCPPRDIPTLEERLVSRFEWGLIADIQPPDLETKVAILRKKAEAENVTLPEDVAMFVSSRIRSNIRELEGSLIRLIAFASLTGRSIDLEMAQETLRDLIEDRGRSVTVEAIQKVVSAYYHIKVSELKSRNNSKHISFPRQVAMYLCKRLTDKSLPAIGAQFGGKHHTTVIHALRKIESMRQRDKDFDKIVGDLQESFK
ncbi:MAG TPA: chromosomal replication initiator protein DnaA [Candidatus Polarisedimenticolia bacterium]|nr:chromosomal replication initiator protein DnaA [Candidatus Polarisedimenticolia bacterium]